MPMGYLRVVELSGLSPYPDLTARYLNKIERTMEISSEEGSANRTAILKQDQTCMGQLGTKRLVDRIEHHLVGRVIPG